MPRNPTGNPAGRPNARLPQQILDLVGEPPIDDPVDAARWLNRFLYRLLWAESTGQVPTTLGARLRATAGVITRATPLADQAALEDKLARARRIADQARGGAELVPFEDDDAADDES